MEPRVTRALRQGAAGILLALPLTATAIQFEYEGFEGSLDTTVSAGVSLRMADRDAGSFGISNGGLGRSVNDDDGNLNYDQGDVISAALKATHDLEMKRDDYGLFTRVTYFYDFEANNADFLGPKARDRIGSDLEMLDFFFYGSFDLGERRLSARVGSQVVNWGESTFIGNSINSVNPVDVAKLRTPGSEVKEALIPSPMLWLSMDLTETLRAEALWITDFDETEIDPRGAFFSGNDFISDDGDKVFTGLGRGNDQHFPTTSAWLPRDPDGETRRDREQYGAALRYFAEWMNNTEVGLFYLRYHNRTPIVSAIRGGGTVAANEATAPRCSDSAVMGCRATYFQEFPESINLWGLSFNTSAPLGLAVQGEYSFRENQPIQRAAVEVLLASLGAANNVTGTAAGVAAAVPLGTKIVGFERVKMHQFQVTTTKAFGPTLGAEQFVVLGEVGVTHLELPPGVLFAGPGTALPAPGSANAGGGSFQSSNLRADGRPFGYATKSSSGYRAVARMDFENVIGAAQISPRLILAHDVDGVGPNFNKGAKAVGVGFGVNYLQRWQGDLSYTNFFGGREFAGEDVTAPADASQPQNFRTNANAAQDRDFLSLSVSYAF